MVVSKKPRGRFLGLFTILLSFPMSKALLRGNEDQYFLGKLLIILWAGILLLLPGRDMLTAHARGRAMLRVRSVLFHQHFQAFGVVGFRVPLVCYSDQRGYYHFRPGNEPRKVGMGFEGGSHGPILCYKFTCVRNQPPFSVHNLGT